MNCSRAIDLPHVLMRGDPLSIGWLSSRGGVMACGVGRWSWIAMRSTATCGTGWPDGPLIRTMAAVGRFARSPGPRSGAPLSILTDAGGVSGAAIAIGQPGPVTSDHG